jgi:Tfp pilus assembly protein PilN
MINLLPPENKKEIIQEENWKQVMILGTLVLVFLVCLTLILFSIKTFISGEVEAEKILFKQKEKELQTSQMQTLQHNLTAFNQTLFQLESFYQNQFNSSEILEKISATIPSGVYLTDLSINNNYQQKEKIWKKTCNLAGFSSTREKLLEFKQNLEKEGNFEEIYFPPNSWMKANDINFTINFKLK